MKKALLHNIKQGDQMKSIHIKVDVGTDEEESRGGGGSPGAPVDHHLLHFILGGPHHRRGRTHKNNRGGFAPAFFGCPSSQRCGALRMRRREVLIWWGTHAPSPFQLVGNQFMPFVEHGSLSKLCLKWKQHVIYLFFIELAIIKQWCCHDFWKRT